MTKKYKLLLSGSALAATAAIVPLSIVACGSTATDMTQTDANKAAVITATATPSTDTKKYYTPAVGTTAVKDSATAKTELAELGITLTSTSQSGKNDFVISSYTIAAGDNNTSVNVTLTGKSGATELTTTAVKVSGFTATTDMNQTQASDYAKVATAAVSGKPTPVVTASDVAITNANAVDTLKALGITLTLGATPVGTTAFTISSYSIAAGNDATNVIVTIKGKSGAATLATTAVTVTGFTALATQADFNTYATVAATALTDKTYNTPAVTTSDVAITNANAAAELAKLGITLTLAAQQPTNKAPITITSYSITAGNTTSVSVTIKGTSGAAPLATTAVTVTGFTAA